MPTAREHIGGTRVKDRIYVLGGRSGGTNLRVVQALDLDRDRWLRRRPLRLSRSGFQAVTVRGRIVVAGGEELAEGDDTIASVELYDPKDGSSRRLPKMLTPRHGLGVVAKGRRIFALEGGPQPGLAFSSALEALRVSGKR
jgi:serine/threonine-protein kinase PknK